VNVTFAKQAKNLMMVLVAIQGELSRLRKEVEQLRILINLNADSGRT
jgi:hypothetical protein